MSRRAIGDCGLPPKRFLTLIEPELFAAVAVLALKCFNRFELVLFFRQQFPKHLPLDLVLFLGQALSKMLDVQTSDPLIHAVT
jgi:hypothetical protein